MKLLKRKQKVIRFNGFTLIELLAVIVILALIAVISTPIIIEVIENTRKDSYARTADGLLEGAKNVLMKEALSGTEVEEIVFDFSNNNENVSKLTISGELPTNGVLTIDKDGNTSILINNDKYCARKLYNEDRVSVMEYDAKTCTTIYKEEILNGNYPKLDKGMTPIYYDGYIAKVADITSEWYSYTNSRWANAVIIKEDARSKYKTAGTVVAESDILAYFVWIPRYEYTKKGSYGVNGKSTSNLGYIDIKFVDIDAPKVSGTATYNEDTPSNYLTHPAFTFGASELRGIWVGKFETTGNVDTPTIKPNITSLRSKNVSTFFETALKFKNYGLENESRMLKNSEWGAVAYLSQSLYGRCTSDEVCPEVRRNNNSSYLTGYGELNRATSGYSSSSIDTNQYGTSELVTEAYNTEIGVEASTTYNITGIYDMNGGAWEYVMGVLTDSEGNPYSGPHNTDNSGFNGKFSSPSSASGENINILELTTGKAFPDKQYYNSYINSDRNTACNGGRCYGEANSETAIWYGDYANMAYDTKPWVIRGGHYIYGINSGLFFFGGESGRANGWISFRTVIPI